MQRIRLFPILFALIILITACSGRATPEPTEAPGQPTAEGPTAAAETPALGQACNLLVDHVKAVGAARHSSEGPTESAPEVPAAPNATLLSGSMLCQQEFKASELGLEPERVIYAAAIEVVSAGKLGNQVNRLEGQEGEQIAVFSDQPFLYEKATGKVELIVSYRGDEAGGAYWVVGEQFSQSIKPPVPAGAS